MYDVIINASRKSVILIDIAIRPTLFKEGPLWAAVQFCYTTSSVPVRKLTLQDNLPVI